MRSNQNSDNVLRTALLSNSVFTEIAALVFILAAKPLASFLGVPSPWALVGVGASLMLWAYTIKRGINRLGWPVKRNHNTEDNPTSKGFAKLIIEGDLLWVAASVILLVGNWVPFTTAGKWFVAIQADAILMFAIWQYIGLRKYTSSETSSMAPAANN